MKTSSFSLFDYKQAKQSKLASVIMFINTMCSTRIFPSVIWYRAFSISITPVMSKNKYAGREGHMFNKLMGTSKKKRAYYMCDTPSHIGGTLKLGKQLCGSKQNNRRIAVLNKLFIKNISDLLVTGSFSGVVMDKGLEISRVAVTSDFKVVNVFWTTNNEKYLDALESILPSISYSLRHELTQLQVVGNVPRINFVKDRSYTDALKVDYLLSIADYGDDHELCEKESDFEATQKSQISITKNQGNNITSDDGGSTEEKEVAVEFMPAMRQDVFNLDHDRIMNKIMKSMKKTRALHRFEPNLALSGEGTKDRAEMSGDIMSKQERKEALAKFVLQRRLLKAKALKNKYNAELNVVLEEQNEIENEYEDLNTTEDFLDDDLNLENKNYNN